MQRVDRLIGLLPPAPALGVGAAEEGLDGSGSNLGTSVNEPGRHAFSQDAPGDAGLGVPEPHVRDPGCGVVAVPGCPCLIGEVGPLDFEGQVATIAEFDRHIGPALVAGCPLLQMHPRHLRTRTRPLSQDVLGR